jgi:hypothetical protein
MCNDNQIHLGLWKKPTIIKSLAVESMFMQIRINLLFPELNIRIGEEMCRGTLSWEKLQILW